MVASDYNSDHNLCRLCDEEPAIYNGLCELCLYNDSSDFNEGKYVLRHPPKHNRRKRYQEDEE